jgi:hypothetical protein
MVDVMRRLVADPAEAYGTVFTVEAAIFVAAALPCGPGRRGRPQPQLSPGE